MDLNEYIKKLLYDNDCVVVPGFGGFIADHKGAYIDDKKDIIYPPSRNILFNKNLVNNDGLLAHEISVCEEISHDEALQMIREKAEEWKNVLEEEKRLVLPQIGILYKDHENKPQFEQDDEVNYLKSAFGLEPVFAPPIKKREALNETKEFEEPKKQNTEEKTVLSPKIEEKQEKEKTMQVVEEEKEKKKEEKGKKKQEEGSKKSESTEKKKKAPKKKEKKQRPKFWYYAAAACVLVLIYSGLMIMDSNFLETGNIQSSDLIPFTADKEVKYEVREDFPNIELKDNDNRSKKEEFDPDSYTKRTILGKEVIINPENKAKKDNTKVDITKDKNGTVFHVVGGCFEYESNAKNRLNTLKTKGYNAAVIPRYNNLYPVVFGSFKSRKKAVEMLQKAKRDNEAAWLLIR
ncbi:MAG: SPOR domain-containing protein [Flavobacteriales bacterium]